MTATTADTARTPRALTVPGASPTPPGSPIRHI